MSNATDNEYAHLTVWSMNGAPVSHNVVKALTEAVEGILKDAEERDGTRLLYNVSVNDTEASK